MRSTSCKEIASDILERCLAGKVPKDLPRALVEEPCGPALFGLVVEGLADRFEPALCDAYARIFAQAVSYVDGNHEPAALVSRYERVRRTRPVSGKPRRIFVLSRVTLGADVAVTSVLMAAAKRRFPHAEIVFVGPRKNYELFAGDLRIHHAEISYRRGGLRTRLAIWPELTKLLAEPDSLVIDPDSRLTQLGLLPVCSEERYHLFESRAYGGESDRTLPELASSWAAETLGVPGRPYVSLGKLPKHAGYLAVSLGVGENLAKRIPDPFERDLIALLAGRGLPLSVDTGGSPEESERVRAAVRDSGATASLWEGSFAGFAAIIAGSRLYVGYDSAGQHVASACGVPVISIFAGFPAPRMFERWRPASERASVIRVEHPEPGEVLERVRAELERQT